MAKKKKASKCRKPLANPASPEHFRKLKQIATRSRQSGKPLPPMNKRGVQPYLDPVQKPVVYNLETREYHMPFNYKNIKQRVFMSDPAGAGEELGVVNSVYRKDGSGTNDNLPADCLELTETNPIIRVAVIGSACTPPGHVQLEVEPCDGFVRPDELEGVMPCRFRIDGLWGMHLRADQWMKPSDTPGEHLPKHYTNNWPYCHVKDFPDKWVLTGVTYRQMPLAGMSCAIFEIPAACKVRILGGSEDAGWTNDDNPSDNHYAFRIIRTTVITKSKVEE